MHTCDTCGEGFETLSELRLSHDPCPEAETQRRYEAAIERLAEDRGLEIGDSCRLVAGGQEVDIVDVEAGSSDEEPQVVWVPAGSEDAPENRETSAFDEVV